MTWRQASTAVGRNNLLATLADQKELVTILTTHWGIEKHKKLSTSVLGHITIKFSPYLRRAQQCNPCQQWLEVLGGARQEKTLEKKFPVGLGLQSAPIAITIFKTKDLTICQPISNGTTHKRLSSDCVQSHLPGGLHLQWQAWENDPSQWWKGPFTDWATAGQLLAGWEKRAGGRFC